METIWSLLILVLAITCVSGNVVNNNNDDYINSDEPSMQVDVVRQKAKRHLDDDHGCRKEFIEEKLIQHSQALEHLISITTAIENLTRKLVDNMAKHLQPPKMPEKMEPSRRSFRKFPELDKKAFNNSKNHWCTAALLCQPEMKQVCGFDDVYRFAQFDNECHMLRVNCYYNYNFSILPSCPV